jgi:ABC-type multidrug transport system fused ATPase/permease subunit
MISERMMVQLRVLIENYFQQFLGDKLLQMDWVYYLSLRQGDIGKSIFLEGFHTGHGCYAVLLMLGYALVAAVFIALSLCISVSLTLTTFSFALLTSASYFWISKRSARQAYRLSKSAQSMADQTSEIFNNMKFIQTSGETDTVHQIVHRHFDDYAKYSFLSEADRSIIRLYYESAGIIFIAGFFAYGFFWSHRPLEWIMVFMALFYRLTPRVQNILDNLYSARIHVPFLQEWNERIALATSHPAKQSGALKHTPEDRLVFEDVSYQYPSSTAPIVHHLDFTLSRGRCVALVGSSGAGKSTILDLATGLLTATTGTVRVDRHSLKDIDVRFWRSRIGVVQQGAPIFFGTVLQNIAWGSESPDAAKAEACARLAGAWDFIEELPQHLHHPISEKGTTLSGGQRQRLALARALYKDPWLLLLDEPTSELDNDSEDRIFNVLKNLRERYTILIASHRLKMVLLADEIIVMDHGEAKERGSWNDLRARPNGIFHRLVNQHEFVLSGS